MTTTLPDVIEEYEFLDRDERARMLIDLGRALEPMPDALKIDATQVRGCLAKVWVYPLRADENQLHFLADSDSEFTKGLIALVLLTIQDRSAEEIVATDIFGLLAPFKLDKHFTSRRTQGIPNMISLIRATAERYAG